MPQIEPRTLQGFCDYLPEEMGIRQYVIDVWREMFERYGYGQLETPVLEYADVLFGKYGEEERLIYHFYDQGERHVGMRYDQTVPLARVVAQHRDKIKLPFKRYEINRVWRAEAARRGRKREFYQCDADILGSNSVLSDAEVIAVLHEGFKKFELPPHIINISHRAILESFLEQIKVPEDKKIEVNRSIDKLDKVGVSGVVEELIKREVPKECISKIQEFIGMKGTNTKILEYLERVISGNEKALTALATLRQLSNYLEVYGIKEANYAFNLSLVRGLDYYTGVVFELVIPEFGQSALAGGGRYDNLCGMFMNEAVSGVGFAVGFERLCLLLQERGFQLVKKSGTQVLVSVYDESLLGISIDIAKGLRDFGVATELFLDSATLGKQLQYADKRGIAWVVICGPEEAKVSKVRLKNMKTGEEELVAKEEVVKRVDELKKPGMN